MRFAAGKGGAGAWRWTVGSKTAALHTALQLARLAHPAMPPERTLPPNPIPSNPSRRHQLSSLSTPKAYTSMAGERRPSRSSSGAELRVDRVRVGVGYAGGAGVGLQPTGMTRSTKGLVSSWDSCLSWPCLRYLPQACTCSCPRWLAHAACCPSAHPPTHSLCGCPQASCLHVCGAAVQHPGWRQGGTEAGRQAGCFITARACAAAAPPRSAPTPSPGHPRVRPLATHSIGVEHPNPPRPACSA